MVHPRFDGLNLVHVRLNGVQVDSGVNLKAFGDALMLRWLIFVDPSLVVMLQVEVLHEVVRPAHQNVDLNRHQLLHQDEVREVRDALQVHLSLLVLLLLALFDHVKLLYL